MFASYDQAKAQRDRWVDEVREAFEHGDSAVMQSHLESDLEGGCRQYFTVADHTMPSAIDEHPVGSLRYEVWGDSLGADKIRWGNPAMAR